MATFQSIQGKTLEQISKNIANIEMRDLRSFIKEYSGDEYKEVTKAGKRIDIEGIAQRVVNEMLAKKEAGEFKNGNGKFPAVSEKGSAMILQIRQSSADWQDDFISVQDMAIEVGSPETSVKKTLDILVRDGFLSVSQVGTMNIETETTSEMVEKYSLTSLGKSAKLSGKKASKIQGATTMLSTTTRAATGPKSSLSGKRIYVTVDGNPCRAGSIRAKHFDLVKSGMLYEDYRKAGGNNFNLNDGVARGFFTILDGSAKAPSGKKQTVEAAIENARKRLASL